jgi:hypothetical protein
MKGMRSILIRSYRIEPKEGYRTSRMEERRENATQRIPETPSLIDSYMSKVIKFQITTESCITSPSSF